MITEIENFTIENFLKQDGLLAAEYQIYLEELNPKQSIKINEKLYHCDSVWDLTYDEVDTLKDTFTAQKLNNNEVLEAFEIVFKIHKAMVSKIPILDFYPCLNFIRTEIENILIAEDDKLSYTSNDPKYVMACEQYRSELEEQGNLRMIHSLSNRDIGKWDETISHPYRRVFYTLWMDVTDRKIADAKNIK